MYLRTLFDEIVLLARWTSAKIIFASCRPTTFFLRLWPHPLMPQIVLRIYNERIFTLSIIYCVESILRIEINGLKKWIFTPLVESLLMNLHLLIPYFIFHSSCLLLKILIASWTCRLTIFDQLLSLFLFIDVRILFLCFYPIYLYFLILLLPFFMYCYISKLFDSLKSSPAMNKIDLLLSMTSTAHNLIIPILSGWWLFDFIKILLIFQLVVVNHLFIWFKL